jgi:hypothetical protein
MRICRPAEASRLKTSALICTSGVVLRTVVVSALVVAMTIPSHAYSSGSGASSRSSGGSARSGGYSSRSMSRGSNRAVSHGSQAAGRGGGAMRAAIEAPRGRRDRGDAASSARSTTSRSVSTAAPLASTSALSRSTSKPSGDPSSHAPTPPSSPPPTSPPASPTSPTSPGDSTASNTQGGGGSGGGGTASPRAMISARASDGQVSVQSGPLTPNEGTSVDQSQDTVNALLLPNSLSAALPGGRVPLETVTSGGKRAVLGATGKDMPSCMAAWDAQTHISRGQWRRICARTLVDPHI